MSVYLYDLSHILAVAVSTTKSGVRKYTRCRVVKEISICLYLQVVSLIVLKRIFLTDYTLRCM